MVNFVICILTNMFRVFLIYKYIKICGVKNYMIVRKSKPKFWI